MSNGAQEVEPVHRESYWGIRQVLSREAERGLVPTKDVCPCCQGLEIVKNPNTISNEYPYGQMMMCPVCSEGTRREYLAAHCGLEGKMMDIMLSDWTAGKWPDGQRIKQREEALDAMRYSIEAKTGIITFWGDFGGGKSTAMAIICNELRDQLIETYYAPLSHILDHLRSLVASKQDSSPFWQRILDVPVLAIDEVTRFYATDWAQERLFMLVDTRYRRRDSHLTLFATNSDPRKELPPSESIGYLYSRFRESPMIELRGDMRPAMRERGK